MPNPEETMRDGESFLQLQARLRGDSGKHDSQQTCTCAPIAHADAENEPNAAAARTAFVERVKSSWAQPRPPRQSGLSSTK